MNRVVNFLQKYFAVISVLIGISILLSVTFSSYIVTSNNHKAAEMYIGTLKYSMTIDVTTTNTLSVPVGETIVDVTITNENPIDTYYKLIYQNNSNVSIKYYESTKDTNDNVTNYSSPNSKITSNNINTIKLKITNSSTSSQKVTFKIVGGFATNTLNDVIVPSGYTTINTIETPSTNTYFCKTNDIYYTNGQYTYAYKQEGTYDSSRIAWCDINNDGWGVQLTDKTSTDAVTSKICTYINNKPITSMAYMFFQSQTTTIDMSNFNTSNVTNMVDMFYGSQATALDLSHFDTSKVTSMAYMFLGSQATTIDVSSFDTSKVTNMTNMFDGSQATTLDVSNFDTSNVTNMISMFSYSKASVINLSNFNTSSVTDMSYMFQNSQATTLDLSNFDTSNVTNMNYMFQNSTKLTTIYVSDKFNTDNVTTSTNMFLSSTKLMGGAGTKYNSSYVDKTYARIDGGTSNPGYFTDAADKNIPAPNSFATDSWKTIIKAVRNNNISKYSVGDTKEIDMGTYGTHTLRVANTSTPSECSTTGFSQSACGFVLEFADIITTNTMNDRASNLNGWPVTEIHTIINANVYNALPSDLRSVIIDTTTISGHGSRSGETNFTSTDKLYLLSTAEIWAQGSSNTISYDTARDVTRQLDYYKNLGTSTSNYSGAIKKDGTITSDWWLRSARSSSGGGFYYVSANGSSNSSTAISTKGVSPAFRIG